MGVTGLAALPALTAAELDVLGRAIADRLALAGSVIAREVPDSELRVWWRQERRVLQSLATAVVEAGYAASRDDGDTDDGG